MKALFALVAAFMTIGPVSAQPADVFVGLPIDLNAEVPEGPPIVKVWPYEGCVGCTYSEELGRVYDRTRAALFGGNLGDLDQYKPIVRIIPISNRSFTVSTASLAEVQGRLGGCAVGADGVLPKHPVRPKITAFGVRADCSGGKQMFLSLSFVNERLVGVYLMPDEPFWVAGAAV